MFFVVVVVSMIFVFERFPWLWFFANQPTVKNGGLSRGTVGVIVFPGIWRKIISEKLRE